MIDAANSARRRLLVRIFLSFALVGIGVAAIPFLDVGVEKPTTARGTRILFDPNVLKLGEPHFFEPAPNRPLIALKVNAQQAALLEFLKHDVWESTIESEVGQTGVYIVSALSTGKFGGCRLRYHPPGSSDAATPMGWRGGYWASGCDASYDYAGRAIKTQRYAKSAYTDKTRSLRTPAVTINHAGLFVIDIDD